MRSAGWSRLSVSCSVCTCATELWVGSPACLLNYQRFSGRKTATASFFFFFFASSYRLFCSPTNRRRRRHHPLLQSLPPSPSPTAWACWRCARGGWAARWGARLQMRGRTEVGWIGLGRTAMLVPEPRIDEVSSPCDTVSATVLHALSHLSMSWNRRRRRRFWLPLMGPWHGPPNPVEPAGQPCTVTQQSALRPPPPRIPTRCFGTAASPSATCPKGASSTSCAHASEVQLEADAVLPPLSWLLLLM